MAIVDTKVAIDMNEWLRYTEGGWQRTVSATLVRDTLGDQVTEYRGTGFEEATATNGVESIEGEINRIDRFVDGVREYRITGLEHEAFYPLSEVMSTSLLSYLFDGNDTFNGSNLADSLFGYFGNDTLYGNGGDDILDGRQGIDRVYGGSGRDILIWGAGDTLDGGNGTDTLKFFSAEGVNLTLAKNSNDLLAGIERIDLRPWTTTLKLGKSDVLDMSPAGSVRILGQADDTVDIAGAFNTGATSGGFTLYSLGGGAKLLIDEDINVI